MTIDEKVEAMARVIYESTEPLLKPNFWDDWTLTDFAKADLHTRHAHHTMARAVLAALRPGSDGWQPIETAPKDGTPFLGYLPADRFPAVCFWQAYDQADAKEIGADGYWAFGEELISDVEGHAVITHWRPLPSPPSAMLAAAGERGE